MSCESDSNLGRNQDPKRNTREEAKRRGRGRGGQEMANVSEFIASTGVSPRALPFAPSEFRGRMSTYIAEHLEPMLPTVSAVEAFHRAIVPYLRDPEAILLSRAVYADDRSKTFRTDTDDSRVRWTDNAPAWWWHALLYSGVPVTAEGIKELVETTPTEWKQVAGKGTLNDFGWHAAHLLNVKDGSTDWQSWTRATVVWRSVRNIHPCNVFYLPKTRWQEIGANRELIANVAAYYRQRYETVWAEFLELAAAGPSFGAPAVDGDLVIAGAASAPVRAAAAHVTSGPIRPMRGDADVWSEILDVRSIPAVGRLLASSPNAAGNTRRLLAGLSVQRLVAIADALWNKCRPADMKAQAPDDPLAQAELAWHYLFIHANKIHEGSTGWTGAAVLLGRDGAAGLDAVRNLDIATIAGVCSRLVRGPYTRTVPHPRSHA